MVLCFPNASPLVMLSMWFLISCSQAKEYVVGGTKNSWKIPLPSPHSLNHWANTHHFKIGDTLIFKYDERTESVHEVNVTDYERCNTMGKEHVVFNDGNTKVLLKKSGLTRHFISGNRSHCDMGLKLSVLVMSNNNAKNKLQSPSPSPSPSFSPSPSPSPLPTPSPSPPPNNQGVTRNLGLGVIMMWLGVMVLLV